MNKATPSPNSQSSNRDLIQRMAAKLRMNSLILGEDAETIEILTEAMDRLGDDVLALSMSGVSLPSIHYRSAINLDVSSPGSLTNIYYKLLNNIVLCRKGKMSIGAEETIRITSINRTGSTNKSVSFQLWFESLSPMPLKSLYSTSKKALGVDHLPDRLVIIKDMNNFAPEIIRSE